MFTHRCQTIRNPLIALFACGGIVAPAAAREQPPGCMSCGVGLQVLVRDATGQIPIWPGAGVIPGQVLTYKVQLDGTENFPPAFIFCDALGGQILLTLPGFEFGPDFRPGQLVKVAGWGDESPIDPVIPCFGNSDGCDLFQPSAGIPYVVEPEHADAEGWLRARSDYGQTPWADEMELIIEDGECLSSIGGSVRAWSERSALLLLPSVAVEATVSPGTACVGRPTEVSMVLRVTNAGIAANGETIAAPLVDPVVTSDLFPSIEREPGHPDTVDDGDDRLEADEVWVYTGSTSITAATDDPIVATTVVHANAVTQLGEVVAGRSYTASAVSIIDVGANPDPDCLAAHPADVNCDGGVDIDDIVTVVLNFGACAGPPCACVGDADGDGVVGVDDIIEVILAGF